MTTDRAVAPGDDNRDAMGELLRVLFPMYRSLCGPGPRDCLLEIQRRLPIEIAEFPTGSKVFDWTIPKEFKVNHSYVVGPDGKHYLPGESDEEIMITSYLCHPKGANDNLSGVVLSVELFKLLAQLPNRRYSYRLAIWPETIGSITYIHSYPDRIKKVKGGYVI